MNTLPPVSFPSHELPNLDRFAAATRGAESVYISVSGQSMQVLGTGTTPGGRSVAWVAPDVDTTRLFTAALEHSYGAGIARSVARELGLEPSPGKPLSSRTVMQALDMARTASQALSGVDFVTRLDCSASAQGTGFKAACQALGLDPSGLDPQRRQDIDQAMQLRFEQAAAQGRSPVAPEAAQAWLRELLRA
ncbi:BspR family type III secretion system anti-sigma factor [Castellaniella defragrans]|uniref:Uncharacterized protein n=1 Tax=Castellaniella defragrans TaxID=75697 RepID=A0A7W9WPK3_CASDE|nr:hypothetical protein [Castellaniella defragrans]KAB0614664.1 hypothetical protein F7Q88_09740 [Castellaniella defragrans]MBB6084936.1 hypothetical protein [Castellaniella defragrans]